MQLLAVACLSLAAKMEEINVPLTVDLQVNETFIQNWDICHVNSSFLELDYVVTFEFVEQVGDPKFVFEGKTIQRMELLVLSTLKWRMQAYTLYTFIDHFVRTMNGDQIPSRPLISRSMQLILSIIRGLNLTLSLWI